jgi:hypothetical protein
MISIKQRLIHKKQTLGNLKVEAVRLATFSTFPSSACAYATKLASAGFYYNGNGDEVLIATTWQGVV